jgi:hypothetical protein
MNLQAQADANEQKWQAWQVQQQNQIEAQAEAHKVALENQQKQMDAQLESMRLAQENSERERDRQHQMAIEQMKAQFAREAQETSDHLKAVTAITVAEIGSKTTLSAAEISAAKAGADEDASEAPQTQEQAPDPHASAIAALTNSHAQLAQTMGMVAQHLSRPKRVVRDDKGAIVGVE